MIEKLYSLVKNQTKWWTIIVGIVETNGVLFGFCCGFQLKCFAALDTLDKFNLIFMNLMLFSIIFYATSFYLLVRTYQKKKYTTILLIYTKLTKMSFFFQPLIILGRSFTKSFIHSYFLMSYPTQIILLLIIDTIFIALTFSIRKLYRNRFTFIFLLFYFLGFAVFDLYFTLEQHQALVISPEADREFYGFILCCLLALLSILLSLTIIFDSLHDIYKGLRNLIKKIK